MAALPSTAQAQTPLPGIVVDAGQNAAGGGGAAGPDKTIVAERTATGTKTDTPVIDIPAAVSVVTQAEMETRGVEDIQQALGYTSGVAVDLYGSDDRYDSFLIRGFDQTTTGIYRDGLSLRFPGWTGGRMEVYGLQRLEVLKGSTSTLFGLNGPGGLINGITKRPQDADFGEVYTTIGEDHIEAGTDFGGQINEDWSYRVTTKGQDGTHGFDYSNDDRIYIAPALTWRPTDATTLTILADYKKHDTNAGYGFPAGVSIDPDTFLGEPDFNKYNTEEKNIGYLFEHKFGNGLTFRQNARYTDLTLDYQQVYPVSFDVDSGEAARVGFAVDGESQRFAIDNQFQYDATWNSVKTRTLVGVDYLNYRTREDVSYGAATPINLYNPVYTGTAGLALPTYVNWEPEQSAAGIYIQEELTFDNRWILTLGGRYDHVNTKAKYIDHVVPGIAGTTDDTTNEAFTKKIGLTYKLRDDISVYANYSESFEPVLFPTFNGITVSGGLEPQEGTQHEVGVKYQPRGMNALFTMALFDLTKTNVPQNISPVEQQQVGEINVRGIELEGKMAMSEGLNLTLAYSYWDAELVNATSVVYDASGNPSLVSYNGNRPTLVPEHLASAWVDYTIPANGSFGALTLGAGVRFVGSTFGDLANTIAIDSHRLVDAAIKYQIDENWSLGVNATNLFDEEYIATAYGSTAYYGDGRTVKATLKHSW